VTCTDYPSPELISTLSRTVKDNTATITSATPVTVAGHKWGEFELAESQDCAHPLSTPNSYTRILAADTLWMMGEHEALAQSMAHFLQRTNDSKVWVVAGFHTGRAKVAAFFAEVSKVGLVVRRRWEVDVNGCEREWIDERQGEGPGMAARWIVVAILGWMEPRETF
jgi:nicotinamide N-methyltransferase